MRKTQLRRLLPWSVSIGAPRAKSSGTYSPGLHSKRSIRSGLLARSLPHKTLHRLVRVAEAVLLDQILVDTLSA